MFSILVLFMVLSKLVNWLSSLMTNRMNCAQGKTSLQGLFYLHDASIAMLCLQKTNYYTRPPDTSA